MRCDQCGQEYRIGEWPYCPHGRPMGMLSDFRGYYDEYSFPEPVQITSLGQKRQLMRMNGLIEREPPRKGDISARIDRCEEMKRCQRNQ